MTPVATRVAIRATSWDGALAETLSGAAERAFADGTHATVHSVHARVVNVLCGDELIAIADDGLDDAPATIRVPMAGWDAHGLVAGAAVAVSRTGLVLSSPAGDIDVRIEDAPAWLPRLADLSLVPAESLRAVRACIADGSGDTAPATPFGRAAATLLAAGVEALRHAVLAGAPDAITAAARGLLGLGEGLTPTGDDILTGLAFLAAHPGMRLGAHLPALAAAAADRDATTLLGAVTVRHAVRGRGRQRLHDLARGIGDGDADLVELAVMRIREIGHTSGEDILTGIRLALDLETDVRDGTR